MTLVSLWQEALGMLRLKTIVRAFLLVSNQKSIGFVFTSDLVKLCLYMKVKVRIETRYEHNELPG